MPANSDVARMGVSGSPSLECPTPTTAALNSLKQQICQQYKLIDNLQRNLAGCRVNFQMLGDQLRDKRSKENECTQPVAHDIESTLIEISKDDKLKKSAKKTKLTLRAENIFKELEDIASRHCESLASILGHLACGENDPEARDHLGEIAVFIVHEKGIKKAVKVILSDKVFQTFVDSMVVPDWVLLYFKISARLPDNACQMLLNLTKLGDTNVS